jgi:amidohydrolase
VETVPHAVDPNRAAQHGNVVMRLLDELFPLVEGVYVDLHKNPELSHSEHRTASVVAEWLNRTGYEVHRGVGGTGVVGILRNGPGPTVMLRADMDALPLAERTGLPYASTAKAQGSDGVEVPVMHACGHDAHTACLIGVADLLSETREEWAGTVMIVAQPGEETLDGAQGMIDDGLYDRFGRPDVVLGQHLGPQPAGLISHRAGIILGAANAYRVRIFGEGGHASQPHTTVDPVVIAASIVTRLQGVVSREISPSEMAVLTVGKIQAGTKANIIPDEAYLEISTRALNENVSDQLEQAIERIVRAEAAASGATREPEVERFQGSGITHNDPVSTEDVASAHHAYFGGDYVIHLPDPSPSTEDFCRFGLPEDPQPIPYVFWFVGATPHDVWDAAPGDTPYEKMGNVPSNHSPFFAPDREPTLRAGLAALTVAALSYLGSDNQNPSVMASAPAAAPMGAAFPGPAPAEAADPRGDTDPSASLGGDDFPRDMPPPGEPHASVDPFADPLTGPRPSEPSFSDQANDAYDSAFLAAASWPEVPSHSTHDTDMDSVTGVRDREIRDEWRSDKAEESTLSADMASILDEDEAPAPPPGPPAGPSYGGPPPMGSAHSAPPPPGPDDDLPDAQYRL